MGKSLTVQQSEESVDPAMRIVRDHFQQSGMTLEALGRAMGYPEATAKKSAWQFLRKTSDPRLSMLRRFAQAINANVKDLL